MVDFTPFFFSCFSKSKQLPLYTNTTTIIEKEIYLNGEIHAETEGQNCAAPQDNNMEISGSFANFF